MTTESQSEAGATVRLSAGNPDRDALISGQLVLVIGGEPVRLELLVPEGPVAVEDVLPIFQGLTDLFVTRGAAKAEAAGRTVSCRAGCGACCRQIVPVSDAEARALAGLVDAMPEPRRSQVRQRFDDALAALAAGGLLARIDRAREQSGDDISELGLDYFHQGIACPFLEDESCSIHPDRPLACREYLVTSPAQNCQTPSPETIEMVKLEGKPSRALLKAGRAETKNGWMPLAAALRFAEDAPSSPRNRTGADILRDVIGQL